jgi:hypothetical protein
VTGQCLVALLLAAIAGSIEAVVPIARRDMGPVGAKIQAYAEAARIARGQP